MFVQLRLKYSQAVKFIANMAVTLNLSWHLNCLLCVFYFQVLGFEVDSINSVQFSNHTGKADETADFFVSEYVCAYVPVLVGMCGCVWVSHCLWCRDEVLVSVRETVVVEAVAAFRLTSQQMSEPSFGEVSSFTAAAGQKLHSHLCGLSLPVSPGTSQTLLISFQRNLMQWHHYTLCSKIVC